MKILMVTCSALPLHNCGVSHVLHHITKELIEKGHEVKVFTLATDPLRRHKSIQTMQYEGYEVRSLNLPGVRDDYFSHFREVDYNNTDSEEALKTYVQEMKPDLVHFHSLQGIGANAIHLVKTMGHKTVLTMHDWWWLCPNFFMADCHCEPCGQQTIDSEQCIQCISKVKLMPGAQRALKVFEPESFLKKRQAYLMDILSQDVDQLLVVSHYLEGYIRDNIEQLPPLSVNTNGVEAARQLVGQKTEGKVKFGFLGGKHVAKGYDLLIETFSALPVGNWELHIYGTPQIGGGAIKKVISYLKAQGIKGLYHKLQGLKKTKVQVHPSIFYHETFESSQKEQVYESIDVLLSLSKVRESSSLVVREALIRQIPVIATPSGGPQEVVHHGKNGWVLTEVTTDALGEAIEHTLEQTYRKQIKEWMVLHPYTYTYAQQVERLIKCYEAVKNS